MPVLFRWLTKAILNTGHTQPVRKTQGFDRSTQFAEIRLIIKSERNHKASPIISSRRKSSHPPKSALRNWGITFLVFNWGVGGSSTWAMGDTLGIRDEDFEFTQLKHIQYGDVKKQRRTPSRNRS